MKRILSYMRRAVEDYKMILPGDRIAVGISGGKDSLTLLNALYHYKKYFLNDFDIEAITLDLGYSKSDYSPVQKMCDEREINYTVVKTNIKEVVFDIRQEKNPCSLCSKLRSGALNSEAVKKGCNKVALGHHYEDAIETFFLSLFYEGRVNCFSPVSYLDRTGVTLIRPLIYTPESVIRGAAKRLMLPVCKNPCPADGNTKRQEIKEFVAEKFLHDRHFKEKIFNAITTSQEGWIEAKHTNRTKQKD